MRAGVSWPDAAPPRRSRTSRPPSGLASRAEPRERALVACSARPPAARDGTRVVGRGLRRHDIVQLQQLLTVTEHAFGIGPVERQAGEELRGHAATSTPVEVRAARARAARLRAAQLREQLGVAPDAREPARLADVAGAERVVDRERA